MITAEVIKAWKEEAAVGPSRVVYDDIGEDYKQRSVVMTFHYERYIALIDEVERLWELNHNFQKEVNELRQDIASAKELLRAFPGCGDNTQIDGWMEEVAGALG